MKKTIFRNLVKRLGNDVAEFGNIGFQANYRNYRLSFYQYYDEFTIEDCGCDLKGKWIEIQLTQEQIEALKGIIKEKENELLEAQEYERRLEIENENDYFEY